VHDAVPESRDVAGQRPIRQRGQNLHRRMGIGRGNRARLTSQRQTGGPTDPLDLAAQQRGSLGPRRIHGEFQAR
jgi:hypothetical protein